jgi:hypothetical protein
MMPEIREWFFRKEGWYAPDDVILKFWEEEMHQADLIKKAQAKQVGGNHYDMPIQPIDFIVKNNLAYREANVIKYVCRHAKKNGAEDIKKAMHYLEMILEEYNDVH